MNKKNQKEQKSSFRSLDDFQKEKSKKIKQKHPNNTKQVNPKYFRNRDSPECTNTKRIYKKHC